MYHFNIILASSQTGPKVCERERERNGCVDSLSLNIMVYSKQIRLSYIRIYIFIVIKITIFKK